MNDRLIHLTQGKCTLVDAWNYKWLNQWKWCVQKERDNYYYAKRGIRLPNGKQRTIFMHREILRLRQKDGKQCDHINHNTLDNCECNLRVCNHAQNCHNQRPQKRQMSSQFKGVSWYKRDKKWQSQIRINGKLKYLGLFKNEKVAALIYDLNARKHFGEFALTNF